VVEDYLRTTYQVLRGTFRHRQVPCKEAASLQRWPVERVDLSALRPTPGSVYAGVDVARCAARAFREVRGGPLECAKTTRHARDRHGRETVLQQNFVLCLLFVVDTV
jgi:hypothetical protein